MKVNVLVGVLRHLEDQGITAHERGSLFEVHLSEGEVLGRTREGRVLELPLHLGVDEGVGGKQAVVDEALSAHKIDHLRVNGVGGKWDLG